MLVAFLGMGKQGGLLRFLPAEGAARTVYVVFPPEPAPQANPLQPSPPGGITPADKKLILDAAEKSGLAVFLAGWSEPTSMFSMAGPPYEFAEYLKTNWGIDVQFRYLAMNFAPSQDPGKQDLYIPASRDVVSIPTPPLRVSSFARCSASIDFQNTPDVPLPNTLSAFLGSMASMKLCRTKASNSCAAACGAGLSVRWEVGPARAVDRRPSTWAVATDRG